METILYQITEILKIPGLIINQLTFIPEIIRNALIECVNFIPILYFLYLIIEYLERFFLKHIRLFIKLMKKPGSIFGILCGMIPECGYPILSCILYSRKMITRGTLLAVLISTSDDAIPLLFMDTSKIGIIIPIIVIKIIAGLIVGFSIDLISALSKERIENINAVNIDIYERGCCSHRISSLANNPPYWWLHPLTHTLNMFIFTFVCLVFINFLIVGMGSTEIAANNLLINSPYQVIVGAILGLIPNCVTSIFIALAFIKGLISFPTLLASLITTTGLAFITLTEHNRKNFDNFITIAILLLTGIIAGLLAYNTPLTQIIQNYIKG
jgi:hypothetical protein